MIDQERTAQARFTRRLVLALVVGSILIAVVGGGALLFIFLRSPDPRAVCDRIDRIGRQHPEGVRALWAALSPGDIAGQVPPPTGSLDERCMWFFTTYERDHGADYRSRARCLDDAESVAEVAGCVALR